MYFLKIDDEVLPTPCFYTVSSDDIDSADSKRSDETGVMHRRRLRAGVRTVTVKWRLDGQQAAALVQLLSAVTLNVTMLDTADMQYYECEMFASDLKSAFYQHQNRVEDASWWEISCRLTQY